MEKVQFLAALDMMKEIMNLHLNITPILKVVDCEDDQLPYSGDGNIINSPILNGLKKDEAIKKIINYFEENNIGQKSIN